MTEGEIILVAALAGLAIAITLGDLLVSWWRIRRRAIRTRTLRLSAEAEDQSVEATREVIRHRLAAIVKAGGESGGTPTPAGEV